MALDSFKVFLNSALTNPLSGALAYSQASDGSSGESARVKQVWFGSANSARKVQATSNPGVDQITLSILDANTGAPLPDTAVKLSVGATEPGDWGLVTAGADVDLGLTITGGAGNAVSVFVRLDDTTGVIGNYTDLSLETVECDETAV